MEPGPTIKQEKNDKNKTSNIVSNVGDVLQPLRVRRYSDNTDEFNWLCFGLYFYFSGNNPFLMIKDIILTIYQDKIKHHYEKIKNKKESQL
jgi:hypothetical protein